LEGSTARVSVPLLFSLLSGEEEGDAVTGGVEDDEEPGEQGETRSVHKGEGEGDDELLMEQREDEDKGFTIIVSMRTTGREETFSENREGIEEVETRTNWAAIS
jgi:hypothetical protein